MSQIAFLNSRDFASKTGSGKVLLDFFAEWCGPCKRLTPILEEVAPQISSECAVYKVDIDAEGDLAARFQVSSVPTLVLLKDGKEIGRVIGLKDAETLKSFVRTGKL